MCVCIKVLLTEKGVSVTGTMLFVYYTWITPERVMEQMAGKTIGPAKIRWIGAEICVSQVQFGFRALAHTQSVFHKIPQMSRFVFFFRHLGV